MNSPTDGWAGGIAGSILYWNGEQWFPTSTGSDGLVTGISASSSSGWLCSGLGEIYRYESNFWL